MKRCIIISLFFCWCFLFSPEGYAQKDPVKKTRPVKEKKDSAQIYRQIQSYSERSRFTKALYRALFRPVSDYKEAEPQPEATGIKKIYYAPFEGKVIRHIYVQTMDPFGYSTSDTSLHPRFFMQKAGNALHVKTLPLGVKNLLIIKKHDTFDSLRVKESERLIRSQAYVREVFFYPQLVGKTDSVDIYIRVYDVWSIIVTGAASKTKFVIDVKDKNFAGLGHKVENNYKLNHTTGESLNKSDYYISNIRDTYISTTLHYEIDNKRNYNESVSIDRPFYSVFTRWGWGSYFSQSLSREDVTLADSSTYRQTYKNNTQDYWLGKSWQLFKGKTEDERTTSVVLSGRYIHVHYPQRLPAELDTMNLYTDENFYMIGAGLSKRKSKQDSYIFKYGFTEDVPVGKVYSLVSGYQIKGPVGRWYVGSRFYWGSYYDLGYMSINLEYGTFIRKNSFEEGSFTGGINYFSPILNFGRWKFRQFFKAQYTQGMNRLKDDNITLNDEYGIRGFNSVGLEGTQKVIGTLQTQSYAPWNLWGFRFGPYLVCSFGMLGTESGGFHRSPVYSQFGVGMLIKNEFLVISSLEISVAFFPFVPGVGNNLIKPNPFKTTDLGFQDASIGRPSTVSYE